jgi:hypothetical protein
MMRRAVATLALVCALAGCSSADTSSAESDGPELRMSVPAFDEGLPRNLRFGDHAIGQILVRDSTVDATVSITVESVRHGDTKAISGLVFPGITARSRAYYVDVSITHRGGPDAGGLDVPLYVQDRWDGLKGVMSSPWELAEPFRPCPSGPLPAVFESGDRAEMCLVFTASPGRPCGPERSR